MEILHLSEKYAVKHLTLLEEPRKVSLGACLNLCVDASIDPVLTKMDDDDYYGPNYLADQVNALTYSGADVVGKLAHFMYIDSRNAAVLRFDHMEHRFSHMVMGPTIMARREVFESILSKTGTAGKTLNFSASLRCPVEKSIPQTDTTTTSIGLDQDIPGPQPTTNSSPPGTFSSGEIQLNTSHFRQIQTQMWGALR